MKKLLAYRQLTDELKLSALVEAHSEEEISRAVKAGSPDHRRQQPEPQEFPGRCEQQLKAPLPGPEGLPFRLRERLKTRSDIEKLEANGTDAVLIGETLMRAADKKAMLDTLRGV